MLLNQTQKLAIKLNGSIISTYNSTNEAEIALITLKSNNPLYESASIVVIDNNNKELLLG